MAEREENDENTSSENSSSEKESKILCLSKEMLPCKLLFFVFDASLASVSSFLNLFYVKSGLTVAQVGLSTGIASGFALITGPVWGGFIDSTAKHRTLLFTMLVLVTTVLEFIKPWVVLFVAKTKVVSECMDNTTVVNISFEEHKKNCTSSVHLLNPNTLFYAAAVNSILSSIFFSGLLCYIEGAIIKTVFTRKREHSYGEQKVFGPIGFGLGSFVAGVAIDHYKPKHLSHFTAAFYVYLPFSLMMIPLLYILTKQANWNYGRKKKSGNKITLIKHVMTVFKKCDNLVFLLSVFIAGLSASIYRNYLFLFMDHVMKPTETMMSLTTVVAMVSELVIYPFSSKLIQIFGGPIRCVILGLFTYSFRFVVLSFCKKAWCVLLIELTHGIGMSLSWTAMIEHTWAIFPKEISTTAIAMLLSVHFTGSNIVSSMLGGFVYYKFGGVCLFRGMAIINAAWSIVMILYFGIRYKRSTSSYKLRPVEKVVSQDIDIELEEGCTK